MKLEIDFSELSQVGEILARIAPKQAERAARQATIAEARGVKSRAKAAAPTDRPWLATQGIARKTFNDGGNTTSSIYGLRDPEGRNVPLYTEFGTSDTPPQPFLGPALAAAESTFPAAVLAAIDPFAQPSGTEGGDE